MWSKSNSLTIAWVAIGTVLVSFYTTGLAHPIASQMGIASEFLYLVVTAILIALGVVAALLGADLPYVAVTGTLGIFVLLTFPLEQDPLTLTQNPLLRYMTLAAILFCLGMYGMVVSRNAVRVLMSIELMLNAININLVAFARYVDPLLIRGQVFSVFILTVAAAEATVGLAIVLAIYRNMSTVDMEKFNLLKW